MIFNYVIPIAIQQALISLNFILDNLMVSSLGSISIAALGASNRVIFIARLGIICFSIANAVLSAQLSKKHKESIGSYLGVSIIYSLIFSLIFVVAYFSAKSFILNILTNNCEIKAATASYLDIVIFSSFSLSIMLSFVTTLRSLGAVIMPLISAILTIKSNFLFNYILLFHYNYGLKGAAFSTILSELIGTIFLIVTTLYFYPFVATSLLNINSTIFKKYGKLALPIITSGLIWSIYTLVIQILYGKLGTDQMTAYGVIAPIEMLLMNLFSGYAFSTLVLIGRNLAENKKDQAYTKSKNFLILAAIIGSVVSLTLLLFAENIVNLYNVSEQERIYAIKMLKLLGLFAVVKILAATFYDGILRAGGDMKFVLYMTTLLSWGIIVPFSLAGYYFANWNFLEIYIVINSAEIVTLGLMYLRFISKKWMNNLVE